MTADKERVRKEVWATINNPEATIRDLRSAELACREYGFSGLISRLHKRIEHLQNINNRLRQRKRAIRSLLLRGVIPGVLVLYDEKRVVVTEIASGKDTIKVRELDTNDEYDVDPTLVSLPNSN